MNFKEILERYENDIEYANRMLTPDSLSFFKKTEEYWTGYKRASYKWFQDMKAELNFKPEIVDMTEEEKIENIYIDEYNNYFYPCQWLKYRDELIPIYIDDYGQQEFIKYKNRFFYGGSYNIYAEYDFCSFIDTVKDNID